MAQAALSLTVSLLFFLWALEIEGGSPKAEIIPQLHWPTATGSEAEAEPHARQLQRFVRCQGILAFKIPVVKNQ